MSVSRKLFRLFKSFNEWIKIKEFLKQDLKPFDKYLSIATRVAFLLYWVFDNLSVLAKIKFFPSINVTTHTLMAFRFWLLGLILTIWQSVHNLISSKATANRLKLEKARIGLEGGMTDAKWKEESAKLKNYRNT